jgi:hypothetical protein
MKVSRWLMLPAMALVLMLSAYAANKTVTMEGTLIDSKCYLMDNTLTGNDHGSVKQCGTLCLKAGTPGALLTKDKKFYTLLTPSIAISPYVGQQIRVTGRIINGGSIDVDKAEVNENGQWKPIKLGSMM